MSTENVIEAADLRRRYGDFEAVRGVSFTVRRGELFALLGTNGAGKTTVLETLEGFRRASAGTVRVLGHDPCRDRRAIRSRLGVMLQEDGLFPDLTVAETLDLWRDLYPRPRSRAELLELAGLGDRANVRTRQLSGGQRRRLDLALAVAGRPEAVFLDEPTTGMDPEARHAAWRLIRDLVADGTTVVLTTHYLEEAERLAIMHRGRIESAGTVADVVAGHGDRISFQLPSRVPMSGLPRLTPAGASVEVAGGRTVATYALERTGGADLQRALGELLRWAERRELALAGLQARTASLEDVFLKIAEHVGEDER